MVLNFLKKKRSDEGDKEDLVKSPSLEQPSFDAPAPEQMPHFDSPSDKGVVSPFEDQQPAQDFRRRFEPHSAFQSQSPQNPQIASNDNQLILAKLETIKAQLDFLQQKFERFEQLLKKDKEDVIRWR